MGDKPTMFLDAQTKKPALRCTVFTDDLEHALKMFQRWAKQNCLQPNNLWYADIFALPSNERIYQVAWDSAGTVTATHTEPHDRTNPFKRKRFLARLRGWK